MKTMKKHIIVIAYVLILAVFTAYVALDTFVITRVYGDSNSANSITAETEQGGAATESAGSETGADSSTYSDSAPDSDAAESAVVTGDSYSDENISVELSEYTSNNTQIHVAEVTLSSPEYLQTYLAHGVYGKNVTEATSEMADDVDAILAINGDYYGARESGYVIRGGEVYRNSAEQDQEDLVIYEDGSFGIINESDVTAEELVEDGVVQSLSFGPALVENGEVAVAEGEEVGRAMASNPRTAIGIKADGTYLFVVSDGRTDESEGLSLAELAEFMQSLGAETAYNLDGGGSSTMVFNGEVVNTPTGGKAGHGAGNERSVSDIVYIGY